MFDRMNERVIIDLPSELVELAKRKAAEQGRTLTDVIEDGVRMAIDGQETAEPKMAAGQERKLPRVSSAIGGYNPGFENVTYRDIQAMDDLEYVVRMRRGFK